MGLTQAQAEAIAHRILEESPAVGHAIYMRGFRDGQAAFVQGGRQTPRRRMAKVLLTTLEEGPKPADMMLSLSTLHRVSEATIRRAAKEVGVFTVKRGNCWLWVHPNHEPPLPERVKIAKVLS